MKQSDRPRQSAERTGLSDGIGALAIAEVTSLCLLLTRIEGRPILVNWGSLGDYLQAAMGYTPVKEVRILILNAQK